jgi:hypothetical protein
MEDGVMEIDVDGRTASLHMRSLDGGSGPGKIITIPKSQWISNWWEPASTTGS